jgi:tetratricopeptide (TPR) repeat protein
MERSLVIPDHPDSPEISRILLGYRVEDNPPDPGRLRPFQMGRSQISFQSNRVFVRSDDLVVAFQLEGMEDSSIERAEIGYTIYKDDAEYRSFSRNARGYTDLPFVIEKVSLADFQPAHYRVLVTVSLDGREACSGTEEFDLTFRESIPRPWTYSRLLPGSGDPAHDFLVGSQLYNSRRYEEARVKLETALRAEPDNPSYIISTARADFALEDYAAVVARLSPLFTREEIPDYGVYSMLGQAYQRMGDFARAIQVFDEAATHFGINAFILNNLGECHFRLGHTAEARAAWEKSMEINLEQPEIEKRLKALKEKEKRGADFHIPQTKESTE